MTTSPLQPSWEDEDFVLLGQDEPMPAAGSARTSTATMDPALLDDSGAVMFQSDVDVEASAPDLEHEATWTYARDDLPADVQRGHPGTEYAALPGLPSRGVAVIGTVMTALVAGADFALTGGVSIFFDLCFVVIGLVAAMAVRRTDLFVAGVLPPLLYGTVIAVVTVAAPTALAEAGDGLSKTFLTGLADHSGALAAAYGVALLTVAGRMLTSRAHR